MSRAENMRRIRSGNTKPELLLRRELHKRGLRYRVHFAALPGKPDVVFSKRNVAIFVHGCFWHQHPNCIEASKPRSNQEYWRQKLQRNVERDLRHTQQLQLLNYRVLVLWECEIEKDVDAAVDAVISILSQND